MRGFAYPRTAPITNRLAGWKPAPLHYAFATICEGSAPTRPVMSLAVACPSLKSNFMLSLTGTLTPDDVVVRVSAAAEGRDAVLAATTFARRLSAASANHR